jgi:hypothetical protein
MRNATVGILFVLLTTLTARAQSESFSAHYDHAIQLAENDQYAEAIKELEAAYAVRQLPKVLYSLGKMHQRLGNAKEALSYFQRYLTAEVDAEPTVRGEVEREVIKLKHAVEPTPPPQAPMLDPRMMGYPDLRLVPVRFEMRSDRGLIAGGIVLLSTGYMGALLTGSLMLSFNNSSSSGPSSTATGTLLIPVLGPFISGFAYLNSAWSIPWMMVDGAAQVAGLAMIIAGAKSKRKVPVFSDRLRVSPYATWDGGGVAVTGRF